MLALWHPVFLPTWGISGIALWFYWDTDTRTLVEQSENVHSVGGTRPARTCRCVLVQEGVGSLPFFGDGGRERERERERERDRGREKGGTPALSPGERKREKEKEKKRERSINKQTSARARGGGLAALNRI